MIAALLNGYVSLPPAVQAATISAGGTVIAATIAARMIVYQLRGQATNALEQARRSEEIKLKLDIYKGITDVCQMVSGNSSRLTAVLVGLSGSLSTTQTYLDNGVQPLRPAETFPAVQSAYDDCATSAVEIITTVEKWQIVDPRIRVFQVATVSILHDMRTAFYSRVLPDLIYALPITNPETNEELPWRSDALPNLVSLRDEVDKLSELNSALESCIRDFEDAMQELLLGQLFPNKVIRRVPLDPRFEVTTLEKSERLIRHYEQATDWGREAEALNTATKQRIAERDALHVDERPS